MQKLLISILVVQVLSLAEGKAPVTEERVDACLEKVRVTVRDYMECMKNAREGLTPEDNQSETFKAKCGVFGDILERKGEAAGCGKKEFVYNLDKPQREKLTQGLQEYSDKYAKEFGLA